MAPKPPPNPLLHPYDYGYYYGQKHKGDPLGAVADAATPGNAVSAATSPISSAVSNLLPSGFFSGQLWLRVAEVVIGGALVLVGIGAMIRKPVTAAAGPAVKTAAKVIK